jgi:hypothetical protein
VTVSTTASATTPPVRFAALRGGVPLPWGTVAALAVVLAFANGFVIIALQGAVGAIERTAYDYHLQSALLAKTLTLHNHTIGASDAANPAYADSTWNPEQRQTMLVDVKAVGLGTIILAAVNAVLVAWVTALRGGRLHRRPASDPTPR